MTGDPGERGEHRVQASAQPGTGAQAHRRGLFGTQFVERLPGTRLKGEHLPGIREEPVAGLGEPYHSGGAGEQLRSQLVFQSAELLAHRGLHDVQPLGGTAEVELLRHGEEVAQLANFHGSPAPPDPSCLD